MIFEAKVRTRSDRGERLLPVSSFFVPYGEDPSRENVLQAGELVVSVDLPATPWFAHSCYVKARDRASYAFALASSAVALHMDRDTVADCRIALGGVATKPWRAYSAEALLRGQKASREVFEAAADAELKAAVPQKDNAFKVPLTRRVLVQALQRSSRSAMAAQQGR